MSIKPMLHCNMIRCSPLRSLNPATDLAEVTVDGKRSAAAGADARPVCCVPYCRRRRGLVSLQTSQKLDAHAILKRFVRYTEKDT